MPLQRIFIYIMGVFFAVGATAPQASAGPLPDCSLKIEINAFRGGSPTVTVDTTKTVTATARIAKGSAPDGTTIDSTLVVEAFDGTDPVPIKTSDPITVRLGVGKGGKGAKVPMFISRCTPTTGNPNGFIKFIATFTEVKDPPVLVPCVASRQITKACKSL
ncbi:MAG: hypothetical protein JRJ05_02245 [Deltaproteobacteria bacterium]|nr:hypothetical protein [Deltaproteobacteria bacterium]